MSAQGASLRCSKSPTSKNASKPLSGAIELSFTQEELGQLLEIHRETMTRTLKELSRLNYIELHRGRIILLDSDGLFDFSAN